MKVNLSLKGSLILAFITITLVLVVGYSMLSARYFMGGMDTIVADNLVRAASLPLNNEELYRNTALQGYSITQHWEDQPAFIRDTIAKPPPVDNVLHKTRIETQTGRPDKLIFYLGTAIPEGQRYVSFYISPEQVSDMVRDNARSSLMTLLMIGLATALAVGLVAWWLLRKASYPISRLGSWARHLNESTLNEPVPDFGFRDLNDFAELVRSGLISVQQGLEREQTFLRHSSHELRTPISVIRSNIELLHKLKSRQPETRQDPRETAVLERIDRASQTMKYLTETLLWLSRDDNENLPQTEVRLDRLVQNLVTELKYLLDGKTVRLSVQTEPCTCTLPETAARIVLSNLLRNAFQHTWEGEVSISQQGHQVKISNRQTQQTESESSGDLGFGLGLQLTKKLTDRLGWQYDNSIRPDGGDAVVLLDSRLSHLSC